MIYLALLCAAAGGFLTALAIVARAARIIDWRPGAIGAALCFLAATLLVL